MQNKHRFLILLLLFMGLDLQAQTVLFSENFNGVTEPALPGTCSATSSEIFTNILTPSAGYSGASGSNNLLSRNCNPNGEIRSFQMEGISTLGRGGITVSFGHRITGSFSPAVSLEWSSDGATWNVITYSTPGTSSVWQLFTSATLPVGIENKSSVHLRWTYTTSVSNTPCDQFAGNYRIDDVKVSSTIALPVSLLGFEAHKAAAAVHLSFSTATERNNDYFSIERAASGLDFQSIGMVQGAGDAAETSIYYFVDEYPLAGLNFYRLKQVDFDGRFSYSKVLSVTVGKIGSISLSPSPAIDQLHVNLEKALLNDGRWQIFDYSGRLLQSGIMAAEIFDFNVDVAALRPGAYLLRLVDGQAVVTKQFQK